jgi:AcrR family transcriptional regulator
MSSTSPEKFAAGKRESVLEGGRTNQKRRTMQALMDAATELAAGGTVPTFQQVADKAMVSRATAYRYFSSIEALTHQAYFDRAIPAVEEVFKPGDDALQAIGRAALRVNQVLLEEETGTHVIMQSSMQVWLASEADARPPRPGRRMLFIEPILQSALPQLCARELKRLRVCLSMVMGSEAVLAMRDVAGAQPNEALDAGVWAAQALVRQALLEAGESTPPSENVRLRAKKRRT